MESGFNENELQALQTLKRRHEDFGMDSFNIHPHDFALLPNTFTDLFMDGSKYTDLNVDTVRHWAIENGMPEGIATEMGHTCDIVYYTLVHVGKIAR